MNNRFSAFRALGRWGLRFLCFLRRCFFSRKSVVVYICLATLGGLAWYGDLWLARRGWEAEKARLAAAGESLDPVKILPPLPPDDENFFALPELAAFRLQEDGGGGEGRKRLGMWFGMDTLQKAGPKGSARRKMYLPLLVQPDTPLVEVCKIFREAGVMPEAPPDADPARELLKSAEPWQPLIDALVKGLERRGAMPLPSLHRVSLWDRTSSFGAWMPLLRSLKLYERAAYESGDQEQARRVAGVYNKITGGCWNDGEFIAVLVASALESMQARHCVAGMKEHRWPEEWLEFFAESANEDRAREALRRSLAMERTRYDALPEKTVKEGPVVLALPKEKWTFSKWLKGAYVKYCPEASTRRMMIRQSRGLSELMHLDLNLVPGSPAFQQFKDQINDFGEGFDGYLRPLPKVLISPRVFKTAITLESYYLVNKRYPGKLEEIASELEPRTLMDIDGRRLRYRTTEDGQWFTVWSVGFNGVDDLTAGTKKSERDDIVLSTEEL